MPDNIQTNSVKPVLSKVKKKRPARIDGDARKQREKQPYFTFESLLEFLEEPWARDGAGDRLICGWGPMAFQARVA